MNLLSILQTRIDALPDGVYIRGLRAVHKHIEVAFQHLVRGQESLDDTAFTDAVYRTNQAFEGSLKEAYRVLAGKNPARVRPFDIENHLKQEKVFRSRVLVQLTNYREEWRNPSAHDYCMDFDEDEALLAIVTVAAFSIVLIDQMIERLSFERARADATIPVKLNCESQPLLQRVVSLIKDFTTEFALKNAARDQIFETEITATLAGYLAKVAPDLVGQIDAPLCETEMKRADLLVGTASQQIVVEIKRYKGVEIGRRRREWIAQVVDYLELSNNPEAVILAYHFPNTGKVQVQECLRNKKRIIIITTEALAGEKSEAKEVN